MKCSIVTQSCLLCILLAGLCRADDAVESELRDAWSQVYLDSAREVELISSAGAQPIDLVERPLLRWHNPVRQGETHGDFFVWQRDGQPVVVGTIFSYELPPGGPVRIAAIGLHPLVKENFDYRFRTFSGRLSGTNLGESEVVLAGESAPATPARTLVQMRSLARSCEAWTINEGIEQPLRLLPQPLLGRPAMTTSSENDDAEPADSSAALFAMVTGTDPELLILIQHGKPDSLGRSTWKITPARFSNLPIKLSVQGKPIWEWKLAANPEPYISRHEIFVKPLDPR